MTLRFEWDEAKNQSNMRKHRLDFEIASRVFLDPFHLSIPDRVEGGEERWQTLGQVGGVAILLVAHVYGEQVENGQQIDVVRIVSARHATRRERRRYEDGTH